MTRTAMIGKNKRKKRMRMNKLIIMLMKEQEDDEDLRYYEDGEELGVLSDEMKQVHQEEILAEEMITTQ